MQGVSNNIQNAISYLDVQDGILQGAAGIVSRMAELKSLSQDVLKNSSDIANYNTEFKKPAGTIVSNKPRHFQWCKFICCKSY